MGNRENPITLEYEITLDDFIAFYMYYLDHWSGMRFMQLMILGITLPLFAIMLVIISFSLLGRFDMVIVIFIVFTALWWVLYLMLRRSNYKKMALRQLHNKTSKLFNIKRKLVITPDDFTQTSDLAETKFSWKVVAKIASTEAYIYIYVGGTSALIIPRRAFSDEVKYKEFIETIQQYHSSAN